MDQFVIDGDNWEYALIGSDAIISIDAIDVPCRKPQFAVLENRMLSTYDRNKLYRRMHALELVEAVATDDNIETQTNHRLISLMFFSSKGLRL